MSAWLHVEGERIADESGRPVALRGFNLGGWLNMENFITGFPGHESGLRAAVGRALGAERAGQFFERFLEQFITEEDFRFIAELGATVVRVPVNYRHLEDDAAPFVYKEAGFRLLDRAVTWGAAHKLYVIIDLHAAPGWQNRGWHCDNPSGQATLYGQRVLEDRVVGLWEAISRRYRDEPWVAGYNLLNEPDSDDPALLNSLHRRITGAIRAIDPRHLIFLDAHHYGQRLDLMDEPYDAQTVYSTHRYVNPAVESGQYPGSICGRLYDAESLDREYANLSAWARERKVPHWHGEFGCIYTAPELDESRLRVMADQLTSFNRRGDHWTLWTYKDIGKMGLVMPRPDSPWMQCTAPVREAKAALRCDAWIERQPGVLDDKLQELAEVARGALSAIPGDWSTLGWSLTSAVGDMALSQLLLPPFAAQFAGMNEAQIDTLMASFRLDQCVVREPLAELLRAGFAVTPDGAELSADTPPAALA